MAYFALAVAAVLFVGTAWMLWGARGTVKLTFALMAERATIRCLQERIFRLRARNDRLAQHVAKLEEADVVEGTDDEGGR